MIHERVFIDGQRSEPFLCLDDKHQIKIGDPHWPVAAAERWCRVLVVRNESLLVTDHDFTTFSIVPSVLLIVDIPCEISGSWYTGQVFVCLKDAVFEQSSLIRYLTELHEILKMSYTVSVPILFLYTDRELDHWLSFISVSGLLSYAKFAVCLHTV